MCNEVDACCLKTGSFGLINHCHCSFMFELSQLFDWQGFGLHPTLSQTPQSSECVFKCQIFTYYLTLDIGRQFGGI